MARPHFSETKDVTHLAPTGRLPRARRAYHTSREWLRRNKWLAIALILAGVALHVFGELVDELVEGTLLPVDRLILSMIEPSQTAVPGQISLVLSEMVRWPWAFVIAAPFIVFLTATARYRVLAAVALVPLATLVLSGVIKLLFQRSRPVTALVEEISHSFPSAHAMGATVYYGLLAYVAWRFMTRRSSVRAAIAVVAGLLIIGTGLARIYLHVHYPTDVLAGWAAGVFILAGTIVALETWPDREDEPTEV